MTKFFSYIFVGPGTCPTNGISIELEIWSTLLQKKINWSQQNFAHITTVLLSSKLLSWRLQNFIVIRWICYTRALQNFIGFRIRSSSSCKYQGSFCLRAQPMRADVSLWRHLPLAGCMYKLFLKNGCHQIGIFGSPNHDDVIEWKHFPRYWPFVQGIHWSPVNSPHKGQWRGALIFSLICVWINGWINNHEAVNLRRYHAHYDISVMCPWNFIPSPISTCLFYLYLRPDCNPGYHSLFMTCKVSLDRCQTNRGKYKRIAICS